MPLMDIEPPSPVQYLIGSAVMMIGVVLPVGYIMFRNKRVLSPSSYSKQTFAKWVGKRYKTMYAQPGGESQDEGGLPAGVRGRDLDECKTGDVVTIELGESKLINHTTEKEFKLKPIGDAGPVIEAWGIFAYARKAEMIPSQAAA